ncbi:MAG: SpoIID/LytB domain-containing protein [Phycisphaerae bacterium]|nr:SpoIID/LytB domain-containing protein [Phycisphaerae bacterium]
MTLKYIPKYYWIAASVLLAVVVALVSCYLPESDLPGYPHATNKNALGNAKLITNVRILLDTTESVDFYSSGLLEIRQLESRWPNARTSAVLATLPGGVTYKIKNSAGQWIIADSHKPQSNIIAHSQHIEISPLSDNTISYSTANRKRSAYRGSMRLFAKAGPKFYVVNALDMEDYLLGVVSSESYSSWNMPTLRAQAIIARTYALYQRFCDNAHYKWDMQATQASQAYGGIAKETSRASQAVRETAGIVLAFGEPGQEKLFPTYYSAICGGHTQDASAVFNENLTPLKGVPCPYCKSIAPAGRYQWKTVSISKKVASQRIIQRYPSLAGLGQINQIEIESIANSGRLESVKLYGSTGRTANLKASELRLAITTAENPVLSSWYKLTDDGKNWIFSNGRGWGHGVGLCQWGSQQMAIMGKNSVQILNHYYPEATLIKAY